MFCPVSAPAKQYAEGDIHADVTSAMRERECVGRRCHGCAGLQIGGKVEEAAEKLERKGQNLKKDAQ